MYNCEICNNIIKIKPVFCSNCQIKFCFECITNYIANYGPKCLKCKITPLDIIEIDNSLIPVNYDCKLCGQKFYNDKNLFKKHLHEKHLDKIIGENMEKQE